MADQTAESGSFLFVKRKAREGGGKKKNESLENRVNTGGSGGCRA